MDGYFGLRAVHPGVCEVDDGFTVKYIAGCQLVSSSISKRGQNTSSSLHLASSFRSLIELYYNMELFIYHTCSQDVSVDENQNSTHKYCAFVTLFEL